MMQALVNTAPGLLELRQLPLPQPEEGQVRIRTLACGICATDLEMIAGWERTGFPSIPGHEWCGVVDAAGPGVDSSLVGTQCVGDNVLADGGEVGFEHPGGYAQFFLTQAVNLRVLPSGTAPAAATLIEPLAVCLRALRRLRPLGSRRTLVVGDGAIGQLMGVLLQDEGTAVDMVGGVPERLSLAEELGTGDTWDYRRTDFLAQTTRAYPVVVEASGSPAGLTTAIAAAANEGSIAILGDYAEATAGFLWNDLLHRELAIFGSNAGTGSWDEAVSCFAKLQHKLERVVTHVVPFADYPQALRLVRERNDGALRVVLSWGPESQEVM
jgi:threonine dehydrogenase-like Zn-dependent dehydrogenase